MTDFYGPRSERPGPPEHGAVISPGEVKYRTDGFVPGLESEEIPEREGLALHMDLDNMDPIVREKLLAVIGDHNRRAAEGQTDREFFADVLGIESDERVSAFVMNLIRFVYADNRIPDLTDEAEGPEADRERTLVVAALVLGLHAGAVVKR